MSKKSPKPHNPQPGVSAALIAASKASEIRKKIVAEFEAKYPDVLLCDTGRYFLEGALGSVSILQWESAGGETIEVGGVYVPPSRVRVMLKTDVELIKSIDAEIAELRVRRLRALGASYRRAASQPVDMVQAREIFKARRAAEKSANVGI